MDSIAIEFVVLVNTLGRYAALPRAVLEGFAVDAAEHDDVDQRLQDANAISSPPPGWGYCGSFTAQVPAEWWAGVSSALDMTDGSISLGTP